MILPSNRFHRIVAVGTTVVIIAACSGRATAPRSMPTGATLGPSGFATILSAPPTDQVEQPRHRPMTAAAMTAMMSGANPDDAATEAARVLDRRIAVAERGDYIGMRVVRDPAPRFAFQFRKNGAATLARYTRDPRFTSRNGGIPTAELQPIFDEWWQRLAPFRMVGGAGIAAFDGVVRFDTNIDEASFREIAKREAWVVPDRVELRFSPPRNPRSIDPALVRHVRMFAREDRLPGYSPMAQLTGRVILRDGCFRVIDHGRTGEPLVVFGRDVELGLDADGYMGLKDAASGRITPRIGERVMWAGPQSYSEADPDVKLLRQRCGAGPIVAVGEPISVTPD